ncbi:MAG: sulfatase-like hydrolase/transferase [Acidobacteriota bacterium]
MTSIYCLLAYIPFTYQWVINCTLVTWLPVFADFHRFIYWGVGAALVLTLGPELRSRKTRKLAAGFVICLTAAGVVVLLFPLLPQLRNDEQSFYWSLVSLLPLVWIAAIDHLACYSRERSNERSSDDHLRVSTVAVLAAFISLLNLAVVFCSSSLTRGGGFRWAELLVGGAWSLASHFLVFVFCFAVLSLIRTISARFAIGSKLEFLLCSLLFGFLTSLLIKQTVLSALSFNGYRASIFSVAVGFASAALMSGLSVRMQAGVARAGSGLGLILLPLTVLTPGRDSSKLARLAFVGGIALLAYAAPAMIATRDWDFLMQKLSVIGIWTGTFVFLFATQSRRVKETSSVVALLLTMSLSVGGYTILQSSEALWPSLLRDEALDVEATLDRYANYDVSFKIVRGFLRPRLATTSAAADRDGLGEETPESFYGFLRQNTNLLPSVKVKPVEINLVDSLKPTSGIKPNIFIFVIDSLRPDYLSPYNKGVHFTPNIDRFARESQVLHNAFTQYGGTVLAEPAIWTGSLQLHKQYIEPYYPMNSLQLLIETEGYESFITVDPVLKIILNPALRVHELDKGLMWFEYDLCRTLKELEATIDERHDGARPLFAYTQSQNLHRMVLTKRGEVVPAGESYPGFYEHYASQLARLDGCFGEFVEYLKSRKLYDNSIIILTSDHGESLNEDGRWGHNYWMFPEIIRIPLIVHLPPELRRTVSCDPAAVSFSTDITPSLYRLLGHSPIVRNPMFGRPLFTATENERLQYVRESYLVTSSYGAVYGMLKDNGRWLYIADAVNQKNYFFDLKNPRISSVTIDDPIRAMYESLIRDQVMTVNRFFQIGHDRDAE